DSNLDKEIQSLLCYRYTTRQKGFQCSRIPDIETRTKFKKYGISSNRQSRFFARFARLEMRRWGSDLFLAGENEILAFAGSGQLNFPAVLLNEALGLGEHGIDHRVVVSWIMVKQQQLLHVRIEGQRDRGADGTVAPADATFVFLDGILGIQDQDVAAFKKVHERRALFRSDDLLVGGPILFGRMEKKFVRLVIGDKSDRAGRSKDPVAGADPRMIHKFCLYPQLAQRIFHLGQLFDRDLRGKLPHGDGEKRRLHRFRNDLAKSRAGAIETQNADFVFLVVGRLKEGQALDVIPVGVSDEERKFDGLSAKLFFQRRAERSNAGAGVKNNNFVAGAQLHARGVPAVAQRGGTRHRDGAACSPKLDSCRTCSGFGHGKTRRTLPRARDETKPFLRTRGP